MANRLAQSASLYLRQHADNPVDWFPWGDEAFQKAADEQKPVFLSVGYSSCHWCHVMAHESFEDAAVAELLNRHFVSIKLDREERPDVDEAYMAAVQLATQRGGWPMTVFMTPERDPFFAGTYFPRDDRGQSPGFLSIVKGISEGWTSNREEFEGAAREFASALRELIAKVPPDAQSGLHEGLFRSALGALHHDFDPSFAGFGGAPKFPPHTAIELCLNLATSSRIDPEERELSAHMANSTLRAMACGGLRDHVGGGFHRYATDAHWGLPHFEKMLIDNALMLANYAVAARVTGDPSFQRVADEIIGWLEREMKLDGLYCSALDADTEGEEGKTYTWTWPETRALLGGEAEAFMEAYGFAPNGNFDDEATGQRTGGNIPMLDLDASHDQLFERERATLLEARLKRPQPARDDKAIVGHNGLLVAAFALAGRLDLARSLAGRLREFSQDGIPRYIGWREGEGSYTLSGYGVEPVDGETRAEAVGDGFLEDYAGLALGMAILSEFDPNGDWLEAARKVCQEMVDRFWNRDVGAFFTTGDHQEALFGRVRPIFDQPAPSATALAVRAMVRTGFVAEAQAALASTAGWMERVPQATEALHTAYLEALETPQGPIAGDDGVKMWLEWQTYPHHGTLHFTIPAGWHIGRDALDVRTPFPVKMLFTGEHGEGDWKVPFVFDMPTGWTGTFNLVVRWQICTDTECLPWAERQWQMVVALP